MKIAITTQGQDLSSHLETRFGRTNFIVLIDTDTGKCLPFDNSANLSTSSGAGIQTAQNVDKLGAQTVITGNVGPNAMRALNAASVEVFLSDAETAQQALDLFNRGELNKVTQANVEGHWA